MKISNVQFQSIDDNGQNGSVRWHSMDIDGEYEVFGTHQDGALLDVDGAPVTPGDELYRAVQYSLDQFYNPEGMIV